jgi:hypothetical protein
MAWDFAKSEIMQSNDPRLAWLTDLVSVTDLMSMMGFLLSQVLASKRASRVTLGLFTFQTHGSASTDPNNGGYGAWNSFEFDSSQ